MGKKTIEFFDLKQFDGSRVSVWEAVITHIQKYDQAVQARDTAKAAKRRAFVVESCHRTVIMRLLQISQGPHGEALTAPGFPALVTKHAVGTWL